MEIIEKIIRIKQLIMLAQIVKALIAHFHFT